MRANYDFRPGERIEFEALLRLPGGREETLGFWCMATIAAIYRVDESCAYVILTDGRWIKADYCRRLIVQ